MQILQMKAWWARALGAVAAAALSVAVGLGGEHSPEFEATIDSLVQAAYQTAAAGFPCKVNAGGSPRMIRWQDIETCLNDAEDRVDWERLAAEIESVRLREGALREEASAVVASALDAHVLPYSRVFTVGKKDALLPLSNTVLKFLPEASLKDLPVFDRRLKKQIGTFVERFTYEKSGGLSASNTYKLSLFQYADLEGDLQAPALNNRLLLDSYGVPWEDASSRPGFRLTATRLGFKY